MMNMGARVFLSVILALLALVPACRQPAGPEGGEFVRLWDDPPTLDPHLAGDADSGTIILEVFGGLVTLDRDLKVVPDLAESWQVSPDGRTYTFFLRRDAMFHNGRPVSAADVKWSVERAADPKLQSTTADTYLGDIVGLREKLRGESTEVTGVRVIDDRTVEITIDAPKVYFLAKLTYPTSFVLDRDNVEGNRDWLKSPNGTGPFKLKTYVPGELIVLERNDQYHLGVARLARVRFLLAGGTPIVMYENNEIHLTGVGLDDLDRVRDPKSPLNKDLHLAAPGYQTSYLGLDVTQPPLDDIKVRQALAYAINKDEIATKVLQNLVRPAYTILPPGFPGYDPELTGLRYDPEKAKALLAQSKYGPDPANLPRLTLTVSGALGTAVGPDLQAILATWRDSLGLNVAVQQVEFATFLREINAHRLQMFTIAWIGDYPDPQNFADLLFHSQSFNNQTQYNNPEVDRLLETARTERDEAARLGLYRQAERIIVEESPVIPLWHPGEGYVLIKPEVKDYALLPLIVPKYRFVSLESRE